MGERLDIPKLKSMRCHDPYKVDLFPDFVLLLDRIGERAKQIVPHAHAVTDTVMSYLYSAPLRES